MESLSIKKGNSMSTNQVSSKKEVKVNPNLKYKRDKDREMVKGKFIFHEVPGGLMSFVYRAYKEDEVERYDLHDGQIYTLPLGVARHLNKNCCYPEYGFIQGELGVSGGYSPDGKVMKITKQVRRCSFQSLEYIDIEDLTPYGGDKGLVTVQAI